MIHSQSISVILPVLNEETRIASTLAALAQQNDSIEIIVADGGSHDRTRELVAAFDFVRLIDCPAGRGGQMNQARKPPAVKRCCFCTPM